MSEIQLEEAIEPSIFTKSRSKYRAIIEQVLDYFENNPDIHIAKLTYELGADADKVSKKIRDWLKADEGIIVKKKGNIVYFMRNSND